jgi:predicted nucleic acid-binding protein
MILLDTSVLLRLIQIGHPHQRPALEAIALLHVRDRERLVTCPQTLYEMYAVCTRPVDAPNPGLGPASAGRKRKKSGIGIVAFLAASRRPTGIKAKF